MIIKICKSVEETGGGRRRTPILFLQSAVMLNKAKQ